MTVENTNTETIVQDPPRTQKQRVSNALAKLIDNYDGVLKEFWVSLKDEFDRQIAFDNARAEKLRGKIVFDNARAARDGEGER